MIVGSTDEVDFARPQPYSQLQVRFFLENSFVFAVSTYTSVTVGRRHHSIAQTMYE